jgi:nicotinamide-nucleotide amidase
MIPDGARKLDNLHGSAPGIFIEDDRGWIVMLPGVPRELRGMTDDTLLPLLRERGWTADAGCIVSRTWRTTGIAESLLGDKLAGVSAKLAYLPGVDGVDLRATVQATDVRQGAAELDRIASLLRPAVGEWIYGENEEDLAAMLLELCRGRRLTMSVAESCTGGLLGARLTAIPGSSDVFLGGVIAYHDSVKVRDLGVSRETLAQHGAVSEETVREMARGVKSRFASDVSIAITGVAGPTGGTAEKPVGLVWLAAAVGRNVQSREIRSWGDRNEIRYRAAQAAMDLARRLLSQHGG